MGLGGEDKTNGEQEINWLAEIGPKKSEKEKKDELGMEKTMETRKLRHRWRWNYDHRNQAGSHEERDGKGRKII